MRPSGISSELQNALTELVGAAADLLQAEIDAGAEVELELGSQRGRGGTQTPFYSCRPLTGKFIAERETRLERLPEHGVAVNALAGFDGLDRYLAGRNGEGKSGRGNHLLKSREFAGAREGASAQAHTRARTATQKFIEDVFAEQTDFDHRSKTGQHPERLETALARLERAKLTSTPDTVTLVATLHGMTIASSEVNLTKGLTIATPEELRWAPEQALAGIDAGMAGHAPSHLLVALTCENESSDGREVLKDLLRALRLFGDGRVTLGPLAWARAGGEDTWSAVALGAGGRPHGMLVVTAEQEDELRAFCNLVSRRAPHGNELAWALRRFELGCERGSQYEALSDHLLALRALLEPEGPASGLMAGRVAALCATPEDRVELTERMTRAQALERAVIGGAVARRKSDEMLAWDVADHLRALLRDVICGHLSADLTTLADELLMAPAQEDTPAEPDPDAAQQMLVEA